MFLNEQKDFGFEGQNSEWVGRCLRIRASDWWPEVVKSCFLWPWVQLIMWSRTTQSSPRSPWRSCKVNTLWETGPSHGKSDSCSPWKEGPTWPEAEELYLASTRPRFDSQPEYFEKSYFSLADDLTCVSERAGKLSHRSLRGRDLWMRRELFRYETYGIVKPVSCVWKIFSPVIAGTEISLNHRWDELCGRQDGTLRLLLHLALHLAQRIIADHF